MGIRTQPGDVYRLIVVLETHVVEPGDRRFKRFEQAQARVAEMVCRYAQREHIRAVALQRGRLIASLDRDGDGSSARAALEDGDYKWTIEKRWGTSVIRRILLQNGIEPLASASPPRANTVVAPPLAARFARPRRADRPRSTAKHKSTRWHVTATVMIVILAMVVLLLVETGGHPSRFLSAITGDGANVKDELPFDARTSFAPTPHRESPSPPATSEDEESALIEPP
jgi:hypothetical protein